MNLLGLVRSGWGYGVDALAPLPATPGSPRRHWRADSLGRSTLVVTLHQVTEVGSATRLEGTLAAVADLSFGLDLVVASLPSSAGTWTLPVRDGVLSASPWVVGRPGDGEALPVGLLGRLHGAHPPRSAARWAALPEPVLDRLGHRRPDLRTDVAAYVELAAQAPDEPWVPTHGDPLLHQRLTPVRTLLTGWSGLLVAPRERDGVPGPAAELFVRERRLLAALD